MKGRLISPNIKTDSKSSCFSFWYYMYGSGLSTLNIYLVENNITDKVPRWTRIGTQGKSF